MACSPTCVLVAAVGRPRGLRHRPHRTRRRRPPITAASATGASTTALPWPTYGADNARTRSVTVPGLRPPFRRLWTFHGHTLLELPPSPATACCTRRASTGGSTHSTRPPAPSGGATTRAAAAGRPPRSPAVSSSRRSSVTRIARSFRDGEIVGVLRADGPRFAGGAPSRRASRRRSSPDGTVYFGDTERPRLRARRRDRGGTLELRHGRRRSRRHRRSRTDACSSATTAAASTPSTARTGSAALAEQRAAATSTRPPRSSDGRVYVGSIDGQRLRLLRRGRKPTLEFRDGGYVYASPAVWRGVVLVGSYDHTFYAINGATGTMRWDVPRGRRDLGRRVGDRRYRLLLHARSAQDVRPRRRDAVASSQTWERRRVLTAVAADGRLYLVGVGRIYALVPRRRAKRN